jgi:hypothetical protein
LPQQVSPSLGIVRTPEETPSRTRKGVTAQQDGRLRHFRGVPFGLGRVGAARNLERKGGTSPPQSDGSEWNTGPHVAKRNVRLAAAKVAGPFQVGAGGASTSGVGWSHTGQARRRRAARFRRTGPWTRSAVERHRFTASGATAGMLSDRDVHHPELAVSGFGNRNAGVGFLDTRLVSFLIPCRWILRVVDRSPPPAPVLAPLVERPCGAVRHGTNRHRAAEPDRVRQTGPHSAARRCSSALVRRCRCLGSRSNGLPNVRNGAPPSFLWSISPVSLAGGLLSAVAGFAVRWLRPLLLVPYGDPLPPLPLPPVCWLLPPWPRTPRLWQPGRQSRGGFGEWRLRLLCAARSLSVGACQGIRCSNGS